MSSYPEGIMYLNKAHRALAAGSTKDHPDEIQLYCNDVVNIIKVIGELALCEVALYELDEAGKNYQDKCVKQPSINAKLQIRKTNHVFIPKTHLSQTPVDWALKTPALVPLLDGDVAYLTHIVNDMFYHTIKVSSKWLDPYHRYYGLTDIKTGRIYSSYVQHSPINITLVSEMKHKGSFIDKHLVNIYK